MIEIVKWHYFDHSGEKIWIVKITGILIEYLRAHVNSSYKVLAQSENVSV